MLFNINDDVNKINLDKIFTYKDVIRDVYQLSNDDLSKTILDSQFIKNNIQNASWFNGNKIKIRNEDFFYDIFRPLQTTFSEQNFENEIICMLYLINEINDMIFYHTFKIFLDSHYKDSITINEDIFENVQIKHGDTQKQLQFKLYPLNSENATIEIKHFKYNIDINTVKYNEIL